MCTSGATAATHAALSASVTAEDTTYRAAGGGCFCEMLRSPQAGRGWGCWGTAGVLSCSHPAGRVERHCHLLQQQQQQLVLFDVSQHNG
jgi:hypothetical protein